ncbi:hypothetical protein EJ110_NYTH47274 [Nymphaea thermarum]|nr:hypothetical protein EJ110_NYTH47274 [Nymphaea thermarum]
MAEWYFVCQHVPRNEWIETTSAYMSRDATRFYMWFDHKYVNPTWEQFEASIQLRFGDYMFIDYDEDLKNLVQATTVQAYEKQFEWLASQVQWTDKALIGAFKGGLKQEIKIDMKTQRYDSLEECFAIAQIYEESNDSESNSDSSSSSEDEQEEEKKEEAPKSAVPTTEIKEEPEASFHSMIDPNKPNAMRVFGTINRQKVFILIDTGATNNFLSIEAAHKCQVPLEPSKPQTIIVGNGQRIVCADVGKEIEVIIKNKPFKLDLLVLPVDVADLILGMTWLATLGMISWDCKNLKMTFTPEGDTESIALTGLASNVRPKAALRALTQEQPA